MSQKNIWMVRAGENASFFSEFQNKGIIAIGWNEVGDLSKITDPLDIKGRVKKMYPTEHDGYISNTAGQLNRFRFDFNKGDKVITYNPKNRVYLVGELIGDYEWDPTFKYGHKYGHIRKVKWLGEVSRDKLSISTKNILGSILTIFKLNEDAAEEIMRQLTGQPELEAESDVVEDSDSVKEEIRNKAHEFIKDQISKLSWEDAQRLVAGILRSMGYKTRISPLGADRSKDIVASKDGLGLEDPIIIVEVKHRKGQMGSKEIRSFLPVLQPSKKGLYVSTGGFSQDAKYEAERANVSVTLIDLDGLVELIVQYYDNFDAETRILIPLTKIYWPE